MAKHKQFQISEFDIEIFRKLAQHYLTCQMIYELQPTFADKARIKSFSVLQKRLRELYLNGFINRDQRLSRGQGPNEYYYFLTKKGANFFEELQNIKAGKGILKRLEMGSQEHAFMISEVMVKLEKDIFLNQSRVKMSGFIRENHFEIRIPAHKKDQKDVFLKPDGTIFLQTDENNQLLFLEVDLSTEPVSPVNPLRSSFKKKVIVYSAFKAFFNKHELINYFGSFKGYRVLVVCRTPQRVASLIETARNMGKEKMFWFTHLDEIKHHNILFDAIWQLPIGKMKSLL